MTPPSKPPFQFGLKWLFRLMAITALVAWLASVVYSEIAEWLIAAGCLILLIAATMTIVVSLEAALGPRKTDKNR